MIHRIITWIRLAWTFALISIAYDQTHSWALLGVLVIVSISIELQGATLERTRKRMNDIADLVTIAVNQSHGHPIGINRKDN